MRRIHRMPLSTSRGSRHGRPRRSRRSRGFGKSGARMAHCASVTSMPSCTTAGRILFHRPTSAFVRSVLVSQVSVVRRCVHAKRWSAKRTCRNLTTEPRRHRELNASHVGRQRRPTERRPKTDGNTSPQRARLAFPPAFGRRAAATRRRATRLYLQRALQTLCPLCLRGKTRGCR